MTDSLEDKVAASEAFAALGHNVRLSVLRAFAAEIEPGIVDTKCSLSFSELADRVDADTTSGFAYHLGKLEGVFIKRSEDGYTLTYAGVQLIRALRAGTYTDQGDPGPFGAPGSCPHCSEAALEATADGNYIRIRCTACQTSIGYLPFPPATTRKRPVEAVASALDAFHRSQFSLASRGVCPQCAGVTDTKLEPHNEDSTSSSFNYALSLHCPSCDWWRGCYPVHAVFDHPAVVAFFAEHGRDAHDMHLWNAGGWWSGEARETDPLRYAVTVTLDTDRLVLILDESAQVVAIEEPARYSELADAGRTSNAPGSTPVAGPNERNEGSSTQ